MLPFFSLLYLCHFVTSKLNISWGLGVDKWASQTSLRLAVKGLKWLHTT